MAEYICGCMEHEENKSGVSIRFGENGAYHDIKCPCGEYMTLKNPKTGVPSLGRMDKLGRSY